MTIYCEKAGFGHISRSFSSNSQLFSSKYRKIWLEPDFFSRRCHKSDRLLIQPHPHDLNIFGGGFYMTHTEIAWPTTVNLVYYAPR